MSRSKHTQQPAGHKWNPPPIKRHVQAMDGEQNLVSSTECTGLEVRPVIDHPAAEAYTKLYAIHAQKPQGNIGKDNPNNDPSEINFHRD